MLVLARERNQKIVISRGGAVIGSVLLVDIRGDRARLGFEFSDDYSIDRFEVWEKKSRGGAAGPDAAGPGTP